ncbi:MAG: dockerin type I repeat-containing protein, partial [Methanosarcinaceae archaeon]|nr:dockerin type I repeat-containing protein [Methanosarcinaceae archaeon]
LKEIYKESYENDQEIESWVLEWFYTYPDQYTEFVLPEGELYLMTLSWFAPESCIHIWDGDPIGPIDAWQGERVKFWHDPCITDDLYVNSIPGTSNNPPEPPVSGLCGDVNGDETVDIQDVIALINYCLNNEPLECPEAANVDGCDGVDIGDAVVLINYCLNGDPLICNGNGCGC